MPVTPQPPPPMSAGMPQPPPATLQPPPVAAGMSSPTPVAAGMQSPPVVAGTPLPPGAGGGGGGAGPGLPLPPYAGNVPQWRLDRAAAAGASARDKLAGTTRRVPKTPPGPPGNKSIFVIVRATRGGTGPGAVWNPYDGIRGYVTTEGGRIHDNAIFHGFHAREEAECYWDAVFPGTHVTWLPPVF